VEESQLLVVAAVGLDSDVAQLVSAMRMETRKRSYRK
jgi:hypothetical protein